MIIRPAARTDLAACVDMIEARRRQYEVHEPVFWKKAADSAESTAPYFSSLFENPAIICLVAEEYRTVCGFLIATPLPVPPVYAPGKPAALIDDFCVLNEERWADVGRELLLAARARLQAGRTGQVVVVCGHKDVAKKALLETTDFSLASEWWVATA